MLQDADPTGEGYIRMGDGVPCYAVPKEGYYDGGYNYIDGEGNYVYSTEHYKIDIYTKSVFQFVDEIYDHFDEERKTWDFVKSKFKSKTTYLYDHHNKEKEDCLLKEAKEAYDDVVKMEEESWQRMLKEALKHADEGWSWYQNKEVENKDLKPNYHHYYTWKIYNKEGKEEGSNVYNTRPILKSGLFEKLDNNAKKGYYQWILKK